MSENREAETPPPDVGPIAQPRAADDKAKSPAKDNAVRVWLLIAFFVLTNIWFLLQFGVTLGSLFGVATVGTVIAGVRKLLRSADAKAVNLMIEKVFYVVLSPTVLLILYLFLAGVTLTHSSIIVIDPNAKAACVLAGSATTCTGGPLLSDEKQATFFLWTTPIGKSYRARLADSDELPATLWPWVPRKLTKANFSYSPSILVRVPYPHADIVDGRIQIRDPATRAVIASAATTDSSASLLFGREITDLSASKDWAEELTAAGAKLPWSKAAEVRWLHYLRPDRPLKLVAGQQLEAVFRTQRQLQSSDPDDVNARAPITVKGGERMQDIKLERKRR